MAANIFLPLQHPIKRSVRWRNFYWKHCPLHEWYTFLWLDEIEFSLHWRPFTWFWTKIIAQIDTFNFYLPTFLANFPMLLFFIVEEVYIFCWLEKFFQWIFDHWSNIRVCQFLARLTKNLQPNIQTIDNKNKIGFNANYFSSFSECNIRLAGAWIHFSTFGCILEIILDHLFWHFGLVLDL